MSYEEFISKVSALLRKSKSGIQVVFYRRDGQHHAEFSDGTKIVGNALSTRVSVRWSRGNHHAFATL